MTEEVTKQVDQTSVWQIPILTEEATEQVDPGLRENDVLLGRGGGTNNHAGNKHYRTIVQDHLSEYLTARKKDKVLIARRIVAIVRQNGGRFLKQGGTNEWEEVEDKKAIAKTSQALRERLDVRNQVVRAPKVIQSRKMHRRDSESGSHSPPRKRIETVHQFPLSPVAPSMVSLEGPTELMLKTVDRLGPNPCHAPLVQYKPQLSKTDVTDECAL